MIANLPEPIAVTLLVIDVLEQLNIPYVVVGSLASAQHGTARSTLDSDLVVEMNESHIPHLISQLQDDFYADEKRLHLLLMKFITKLKEVQYATNFK